jgi:hypothetical protein
MQVVANPLRVVAERHQLRDQALRPVEALYPTRPTFTEFLFEPLENGEPDEVVGVSVFGVTLEDVLQM